MAGCAYAGTQGVNEGHCPPKFLHRAFKDHFSSSPLFSELLIDFNGVLRVIQCKNLGGYCKRNHLWYYWLRCF